MTPGDAWHVGYRAGQRAGREEMAQAIHVEIAALSHADVIDGRIADALCAAVDSHRDR